MGMFQAIIVQHLLGGLLCLPSLVSSAGAVFSSLACHGALCEAGWELQDIVTRVSQRLCQGEKGKRQNPGSLLAVLCVHHAMGLSMVIPMNLLYHDDKHYHEFVFLLQAAAFAAMMLQSYGY